MARPGLLVAISNRRTWIWDLDVNVRYAYTEFRYMRLFLDRETSGVPGLDPGCIDFWCGSYNRSVLFVSLKRKWAKIFVGQTYLDPRIPVYDLWQLSRYHVLQAVK